MLQGRWPSQLDGITTRTAHLSAPWCISCHETWHRLKISITNWRHAQDPERSTLSGSAMFVLDGIIKKLCTSCAASLWTSKSRGGTDSVSWECSRSSDLIPQRVCDIQYMGCHVIWTAVSLYYMWSWCHWGRILFYVLLSANYLYPDLFS